MSLITDPHREAAIHITPYLLRARLLAQRKLGCTESK